MPVLTAVKVRPAIILRPNELHIPRAGVLQSLFALLLVVLSIGLIAGRILAPSFEAVLGGGPRRLAERVATYAPDPNLVGIIGVAATLLILGILIGLLWIIVWLVGKLPSFGSVDLRLALRNLTNRRIRTATTLLALSAGMFALSSIAFFGAGAREILRFTLSDTLGGNVVILPVLPPQLAQPLINIHLATLGEQVAYRTTIHQSGGEILAVDGVSLEEISRSIDRLEIQRQLNEAAAAGNSERVAELSAQLSISYISGWVGVLTRDTDNPNFPQPELLAGRTLTPEDRGHKVAMIRYTTRWQVMGAQVGSIVTMRLNNGQTFEFEIVGILPENNFENFQDALTFGEVTLPPGVIPVGSDFQLNVIQVPEENLDAVLTSFLSLPLVYAIDIGYIDGLMARLIDQMSAIPILVGLLSLGAAAVIMANTVALSTLERRRQIGILKAIGLKGRRVLRVMLLENAIVSLLGGLLGLGLSGLGVWLMTKFGLEAAILIPTDALPVAIALVLAAMFIAWLATVLSAQVAIRERVLNVLRYE
jgi:ABC-type antimicrobial peptide transport system permease subunit